jgi:hypothetical protein
MSSLIVWVVKIIQAELEDFPPKQLVLANYPFTLKLDGLFFLVTFTLPGGLNLSPSGQGKKGKLPKKKI